jgi:hypothetical protein
MSDNATFLAQGAKQFLRRFPVTRIDVLGNYAQGPVDKADWDKSTKGDEYAGQGSVKKATRVWNLTFAPRADPLAPNTSAGCPTPVKITLDLNAGGIPAFYLPYKDNANFRITLDAAGPGAANANFFLTELVDGCSVYVEGTQAKPTCYHINAQSYAQSHNPDSATYLNDLADAAGINLNGLNAQQLHDVQFGFKSAHMDHRFWNDGNAPKTVAAGQNLRAATKAEDRDYMIVPGSQNETQFTNGLAALQANFIVPTHAQGKRVHEMDLFGTQGFIFGIRTGVNWKFYVQRKALVEYFHRTHAIKAKWNETFHNTPRPRYSLGMQHIVRDVLQFWPTAKTGRQA